MTGAAAVFTMTNYWEKMDMELEIQQGKNLADAAKEAGVNHYIWSSLLNVNKRELHISPRLLTYPMKQETLLTQPYSHQRQAATRVPLRQQGHG